MMKAASMGTDVLAMTEINGCRYPYEMHRVDTTIVNM